MSETLYLDQDMGHIHPTMYLAIQAYQIIMHTPINIQEIVYNTL